MGAPWATENATGVQMGLYNGYINPFVLCQFIAIEHCNIAIEIADLPIKMGIIGMLATTRG